MNVAILGGSFNPPHICHVLLTQYVVATAQIDQVWFLPCYQHAFGKALAPFHHRLTMCSLAVASFREGIVRVIPLERDRQGTSWTIDTVRHLQQHYPDIDFTWVIGSDVLSELPGWKDFDQLQHLISFLVIPRAGSLTSECSPVDGAPNSQLHALKTQRDALEQQGIQLPNISSTLVRERVRQQASIRHLVPREVEAYIYAHKLYARQE
ncbi:nicotinate (nicotinamide) nucleotide adenylyltransferase [candidate division KSB3 bacterium]|uniref:Probable nicotinate-nucleotide adenylyltransferase n=1 Tax=candidate division KSB3 bacterium TaxID=2044937 RepID=A0A9D5JRU9_9BACT|nr:nicotinate (nicotinamide) nucleotide adenylyltransferase [candidate division KSB3 bacterium]MBD3322975.1 nicotinate (nicotinamide) nucleotide adenylyltransferase [candidate division KSB3 bacterium]